MYVHPRPAPTGAGRATRKKTDEVSAITDALVQTREDEVRLAAQQAAFNYDLQEKTEIAREANALRDLQLEQMKRDDEIVKKYIEMI